MTSRRGTAASGARRFLRPARVPAALLGLAWLAGVALAAGKTPAATPAPAASTAKPATTAKPAPASAAKPVPAPPDTTKPGPRALADLAFLAGKWEGQLRSYPLQMDISIAGPAVRPGDPLRFDIHAMPVMGLKLGVEGDYRSTVSYSETHRSLRAVLTDANGRGVEMLGGRVAEAREWLFNSTEGGAPFPFKVRLTPVGHDQIVVAYSSGGRMPLKYEVTFNRVES